MFSDSGLLAFIRFNFVSPSISSAINRPSPYFPAQPFESTRGSGFSQHCFDVYFDLSPPGQIYVENPCLRFRPVSRGREKNFRMQIIRKKKSNKKINYTALYITFPCYRNLFISTINSYSNFYHNLFYFHLYIYFNS